MPKKQKTGKSRKDEYYYMAKNTGLRARSSFKLIEINKLFHFLEKATILIDLCAAPGGWMQIAANTMKKSSFIIGVDLVPIKPIAGCISIQADITTDKCKQLIRQHIHKAKADVILHDGAPNVGANWNVDEFQQAHLCLKAFALASEFLVRNGTFVTKVFRSKDYESLKWVFNNLFEKVQVVKPRSSRAESAEIFLVCLKYKAPDNLDEKFLDIQHVFEDVDAVDESALTFSKVLKKNKKALGYEEGDSLYKEVPVTELLNANIPMNILLTANKIVFDDEDIKQHPLTTETIKQYLMDLKLLGKFDFKALEKWCKKMQAFHRKLHRTEKEEIVVEKPQIVEKTEEEKIQDEIDKCEDEVKKSEKKKLKKSRQEKLKQIKLIQMSMLHPGDVIEQDYDMDMFSASKNQDLIESGVIETDVDVSTLDKVLIPMDKRKRMEKNQIRPTKEYFQKTSDKYYDKGDNLKTFDDSDVDSDDGNNEEEVEEVVDIGSMDEDSENDSCEDDEDDEGCEDDEDEEVCDDEECEGCEDEECEGCEDEECEGCGEEHCEDCEDEECEGCGEDEVSEMVVESDDVDLDGEDDEEMEVGGNSESDEENVSDISDESEDEKKSKKPMVPKITDLNYDPAAPTPRAKEMKKINSWFNSDEFSRLMNDVDESDDDSNSSEEIIEDISDEKEAKIVEKKDKEVTKDKLNISNPDHAAILNTLKRKLTPKERALAVEMIKSKKSRREILEWGYNRYQFEDENLPGWFVEDEKKHMKARLPFVNQASIDAQKTAVSTNIAKRTIKKVEQAKARKKHHMMRKLTRLNKRAEKMDDDLMEVEKRKKLQELSKKVHKLKNTKKPVVTEVTNRSGQRSRVGAYKKGAKLKIVDKRMKKDSRGKGGKAGKDGKDRKDKKRGRK